MRTKKTDFPLRNIQAVVSTAFFYWCPRGWRQLALLLWVPLFLAVPFPLAADDLRRTPVVRAVEQVSAAVVNISTLSVKETAATPFVMNDPFFDEFFRDFFQGFRRSYTTRSLGSGVLISCDGHILTNAHVVAGATDITIFTGDHREFKARILGSDSRSDIAVLAVENPPHDLGCARVGNSDELFIGEPVIAIGNPFGFSNTVTTGIISAVGRSIRGDGVVFHNLIQTDTMINPGNSGGPLLNIHGDVIGINTAMYRRAQGIGFSIPVNRAMRIYEYILRHGTLDRAWIGVEVQELSSQLRSAIGSQLPRNRGVAVTEVANPSLFRGEALQPQDVILAVGNMPVTGAADYVMGIHDYTADDVIDLTVWRENRVFHTRVQARRAPDTYGILVLVRWLGVELKATSGQRGMEVARVHSGSWAQRAGFRPGDRILTIDDIPINSPQLLAEAIVLVRAKEGGVMEVARGRQTTRIQF